MSAVPQPQVAQIITPSGQIQQIQLTQLGGGLAGSNVLPQTNHANIITQSSQSNLMPTSQPNVIASQGNQGSMIAQTSQNNMISQANILGPANHSNLITQVCFSKNLRQPK